MATFFPQERHRAHPEMQEVLDFCGEHNITADVKIIPIPKINEAYERMVRSNVKYRFSIDMASLKAKSAASMPLVFSESVGDFIQRDRSESLQNFGPRHAAGCSDSKWYANSTLQLKARLIEDFADR
jgi:hypothetical protein